MWEEDDEDPFENLNEPEPNDDELFYADTYEKEQAGIDSATYELIFGSSDNEDFYGF